MVLEGFTINNVIHALDTSNIGIFEYNIDTQKLIWNKYMFTPLEI
jgi:hypothetical protein